MRRFEAASGTKTRFWEIEVDGFWVVTRWGAKGGRPQSNRRMTRSHTVALREQATAIRKKQGQGWTEVEPEAQDAVLDTTEGVIWENPQQRRRILAWRRAPGEGDGGDKAWTEFRRRMAKDRSAPALPTRMDLAEGVRALARSVTPPPGQTAPIAVVPTLASPWLTARLLHAQAPDEAYQQGLDAAEALRPGAALGLRCALDWLFPQRDDWALDDAMEVVDLGHGRDHHFVLLACLSNAEVAKSLAELPYQGRRPSTHAPNIPGYYATLLDRLGVQAALPLIALLDTGQFDKVISVLGRIRSHLAAARLVQALGKAALRDAASHGLTRMPYFAVPALAAARGRLKGHADPLRRELLQLHPSLGDSDATATAVQRDAVPVELLAFPEGTVPPKYIRATRLPRPLLADGRQLPSQGVDAMVRALTTSTLLQAPAEVTTWRAHCTADSLAALGRALLDAWVDAGMPRSDRCLLFAQAHIGDDTTARYLARKVVLWPKSGRFGETNLGIDTLARLDTDVSWMQLFAIRQKVGAATVRARADMHLDALARQADLTRERLDERLVPDLGLSQRGTLHLDYGPRSFTVHLDERLAPFVVDQDGQRLPSLPRGRKTDDADKLARAKTRFNDLRADAKTLATAQLTRFEQAMVHGKTWSVRAFQRYLVAHRVVGLLARRLVWTLGGRAFRVDETGAPCDAEDEAIELGEGVVGLAHPVQLAPEELMAWSTLLADYEILQPFEQLARTVYHYDAAASKHGPEIRDHAISEGRAMSLSRRGWRRISRRDPETDVRIDGFEALRRIIRGATVTVHLRGAVYPRELNPDVQHPIDEISCSVPWKRLHPVAYSEIARDLLGT